MQKSFTIACVFSIGKSQPKLEVVVPEAVLPEVAVPEADVAETIVPEGVVPEVEVLVPEIAVSSDTEVTTEPINSPEIGKFWVIVEERYYLYRPGTRGVIWLEN